MAHKVWRHFDTFGAEEQQQPLTLDPVLTGRRRHPCPTPGTSKALGVQQGDSHESYGADVGVGRRPQEDDGALARVDRVRHGVVHRAAPDRLRKHAAAVTPWRKN